MIEDDFFIEPATWQVDRASIKPVRIEVFMVEQGFGEEDEWDREDAVSQHFLARNVGGEVIGTARLTPDGRLGRIAVLRPWRGRGVGASLLRCALEAARLRGLEQVTLSSQLQAVDFYARAGFQAYGQMFVDGGIPHRLMHKALAPQPTAADNRPRRAPRELTGKHIIPFSGAAAYRGALLRLLKACENTLAIYAHNLEPRITDEQAFIDEFTSLATGALRPHLRVLLKDAREAVRRGHRLLDLAQRLPSVLVFRQPAAVDLDYPSAFAIADQKHVLFRSLAGGFDGELRVGHRREALTLLEYFDRVWEEGFADPNLRRLDF